jgi:DNA-binding XRE family transcriptional regulator
VGKVNEFMKYFNLPSTETETYETGYWDAKTMTQERSLMERRNRLREIRETQMLTKAELARKARVSPQTIDRIERGKPCRVETQQRIVTALGLKLSEWAKVFDDEDQ